MLCKTSNPSSGELQDRLLDGEPLYARMGDLCESWGADTIDESGYSAVGAVVGATYPAQLAELFSKTERFNTVIAKQQMSAAVAEWISAK